MTSIKAILIDDEPLNLKNLDLLLKEYAPETQVLATFQSADEAIGFLKSNDIDLVFLDIKMPRKDGFEFLEYFPKRNFEVIFVTAYDEFALKAIKESAVDYLLKPILIAELKTAVKKAKEKIEQKKSNQKICLSYSGGKVFVSLEEIVCIQGIDNISKVFLKNGKTVILSKTLKSFESLLGNLFFRVHKSFIINLSEIKKWSSTNTNTLELSNSQKIPVSRRNLRELRTKLEI
ncbi:MAG: LytTR family DNA-binding domain-containing protein [Cruoricaptor ignavus]|nr:LytTR family DNA-binding domain-containing protein [Cruoricaptor ignavus]MDO5616078.1 LytTR family DNA-binding domain-containing protein [Cruoricaptor ignavus]